MLEPPKNIEPGQSFAGGVCSKIREILSYLERSRLIPGSGIRLMETPCGITVSAETGRKASSVVSPRKAETAPGYTGPFSVYLNSAGYLYAIPGLVWTPDGTYGANPRPCAKPSVSSWIVLNFVSASQSNLTTLEVSIDSEMHPFISIPDPDYFNSHAVLAYYDKRTDTISQVHFSPIVYMIATEDLFITP